MVEATEDTYLQIEELCRVCLTKKEDMILMSDTDLIAKLLDCVSVQLPEEKCLICKFCVNEIEHWHKFKQQVLEALAVSTWVCEQRSLGKDVVVVVKPPTASVEAANDNVIIEEIRVETGEVSENQEPIEITSGKCKFVCETCGSVFHDNSKLAQHQRNQHSAGKPFGCRDCSATFSKRKYLLKHQQVHQNRERTFQCEICQKTFWSKSNLVSHVSIHVQSETFACSICSKTFRRKNVLKNHFEVVHRGVKTALCDYCPKSFSCNSILYRHVKKFHSDESDSSLICSECNKKFVTGGELVIHMRTHTGERPFTCDFCQKSFISKGNLKAHRRIHTGERPYVCSMCGKAYATASCLKIHSRRHTGERPYKCMLCEETFVYLSTIKRHVTTHLAAGDTEVIEEQPLNEH